MGDYGKEQGDPDVRLVKRVYCAAPVARGSGKLFECAPVSLPKKPREALPLRLLA